MSEESELRCTECGSALASGSRIAGLCPKCLFCLARADPEPDELPTLVGADGPMPGRVLGDRYQIRTILGRGGHGEVYRAFDLKLRVDVALKAVRAELVRNEEAKEMLRGEVRSAREVVSPHVCRVFDLVVEDGCELVSMEYIDGTTLADLLRGRSPLELTEARELASQFLLGLEAIHEAGLVHRDFKPENVMITRAGRVVVMDFGVAKSVVDETSGTIAGTPAYMAPEQARGVVVDARADVFSAGVVLAEMISDASRRSARQELWQRVRETPPKVPEGPWAPVVQRALAWEKNARYASVRDLARALEEVTLRLPGFEEKSPYPGLASFTEHDAEFFFGRELDAEALWKKLKRPHLLALIGPSGAGKSSFLRAGLLAALPEGFSHVLVKPGERPFQAMAQALVKHLSGDNEALERLLRFEEPETAVQLVSRWRRRHEQVFVVVDQFEELFTMNPPEVQESFATLLGRLVLEGDVHVLLSLRDDFLFHCHAHEALAPIFSELTPLGPLNESAMRRALIQPALACGYRFEDESLVDDMVAEVRDERGALPLLAFAAARLWDRRDRDKGLLTREGYEHIGGVGGALAQHAEATLERIGRERISVVRELFRNLVTAQGTRAARDRNELLTLFDGEERRIAADVIDGLINARLLTSYDVPGLATENQRIEVIHESLLSAWPRLVHWQTQDAEGAQLRDELRQAARMWEQRSRSDDLLWTGSAFQDFQLWRERYPGSLTPVEEAFGEAMTARAFRRKRNRRLATTSTIVFLVGVLAVVASLWRQAVAEAMRAEGSKLVALGQLELETYPTAAVAYALKSLELADTDQARLLALQSLQRAPPAIVLPTPVETGKKSELLAVSPDSEWLAWGGDRKIWLQSRHGGAPILFGEYPASGEDWILVAFSLEGDRLISEQGGDIRIWDIDDRTMLRRDVLEGVTSFWVNGPRFFTSTNVSGERLVRSWSLDDGDQEVLGSFAPPGDLDRTGEWWARRSGRTILLDSLRDASLPPRTLVEHSQDFRWLEFHPQGEVVASIDESDAVHLWSVAPGTRNRKLPGRGFAHLGFDPGGTKLVSGGQVEGRRVYHVWDLTGAPDARPMVLERQVPLGRSLSFDRGGQWLATVHETDIAMWPLANAYPRILDDAGIRSAAFTPDGMWLVTGSHESGVRAVPLSGHEGQRSRVLRERGRRVAIDAAGENVLVSDFGKVYLVPFASEQPARELGEFSERARDVAFSPSGRLAAAAQRWGAAEEKVIHVWNLATGEMKLLGPLVGAGPLFEAGVEDLEFIGENRILAGANGGLHLANLENGTVEALARDESLLYGSVAVSDDGEVVLASRVVSGSPRGELVRWDLDRGRPTTLTSHGITVLSVALDASGSRIASGGTDGVIRVGPIDESEKPHLLFGHTGYVEKVSFSPDGQSLVSVSADGTTRLWPVPRGRPFHRLPHEEILSALRSVTNVRAVEDDASPTGYALGLDPFPGWATVPTWQP